MTRPMSIPGTSGPRWRTSILAAPFAREILAKLPAKPREAFQAHVTDLRHGVHVSVRHCGYMVGPQEARYFEPSGGLLLVVGMDLPTFGHGVYTGTTVRTRRLKPGWTPAVAHRSLTDLITRVQGARQSLMPLLYARERLYQAVEAMHLDEACLAEVERVERASGHTAIYTDMTRADVAFWREYFRLTPDV